MALRRPPFFSNGMYKHPHMRRGRGTPVPTIFEQDPSIITLKSAHPLSNTELNLVAYPIKDGDGEYALKSSKGGRNVWCATNDHGTMQCDLAYKKYRQVRKEDKVFHIAAVDHEGHVALKNGGSFCGVTKADDSVTCNHQSLHLVGLFTPHVEEGGHCALTACRDPWSSQCPSRELKGIGCKGPDPAFCTEHNRRGFVSGCVGR